MSLFDAQEARGTVAMVESCSSHKKKVKVLVLGSGMSHLTEDLARSNLVTTVVGVEFSPVAVAFMQERAQNQPWQQQLAYHVMDARGMAFGNRSFNVIIDEGLLDMYHCLFDITIKKRALTEVALESLRVLRSGGTMVVCGFGGGVEGLESMWYDAVGAKNHLLIERIAIGRGLGNGQAGGAEEAARVKAEDDEEDDENDTADPAWAYTVRRRRPGYR